MPKLQEFEVDVCNTKKKMNQVNVFKIWKKRCFAGKVSNQEVTDSKKIKLN